MTEKTKAVFMYSSKLVENVDQYAKNYIQLNIERATLPGDVE